MEQWEKEFWDHHFNRSPRRFIPYEEYTEIFPDRQDSYWVWAWLYRDHPDNPVNWPKVFSWGARFVHGQSVRHLNYAGRVRKRYKFRAEPVPNTGGYNKGNSSSKRGRKGILSEFRKTLGWVHDAGKFPDEHHVKPRMKRINDLRFLNDWDGVRRFGWGKKDWKKCTKKRKQWM